MLKHSLIMMQASYMTDKDIPPKTSSETTMEVCLPPVGLNKFIKAIANGSELRICMFTLN